MSIIKNLTTACIVLCSLLVINGFPVGHSNDLEYWTIPCGVPEQFDWDWDTETTLTPVPTFLNTVINQLKDSKHSFEVLQEKYLKERVAGLNLTSTDVHLKGFPDVESNLSPSLNVTTHFIADYDKLAKIYIFLEQTLFDEKKYENGKLEEYISNLIKYNTPGSMLDPMCTMLSNNEDYGQPIVDFPTKAVMPDEYRNGTRTQNYQRDFIIIKDSIALVSNMITKYKLQL